MSDQRLSQRYLCTVSLRHRAIANEFSDLCGDRRCHDNKSFQKQNRSTNRNMTSMRKAKRSMAMAAALFFASWRTPDATVLAFANTSPSFLARSRTTTTLEGSSQTTIDTTLDTPKTLPDFSNKNEYLAYMERVSALPQGFATGTAKGSFVSVEAPALGPLPISATVIYLPEGPTANWAAVFTKNKVCVLKRRYSLVFVSIRLPEKG
jgi:hypothetical protein